MSDFVKFVLKCILESTGMSAPREEMFYRYGSIGIDFFVIFFLLTLFSIRKIFYKKHFVAEHAGWVSIVTGCISMLIYYIIAYIFFYK